MGNQGEVDLLELGDEGYDRRSYLVKIKIGGVFRHLFPFSRSEYFIHRRLKNGKICSEYAFLFFTVV